MNACPLPVRRFELVFVGNSGKVQYRVQTVRGRPFDRELNAQVPLLIRCSDPEFPALVGEANAVVQVPCSTSHYRQRPSHLLNTLTKV